MKKKQRRYTTISRKNREKGDSAPISRVLLKKTGALSPFSKSVYEAVSTIPKGETRSYKWVAEKIGRPRAYRAVGNALNKNPYPGIIPCHRVVKSDGSIGGFSRGVRAKKSLLLKEQRIAGQVETCPAICSRNVLK